MHSTFLELRTSEYNAAIVLRTAMIWPLGIGIPQIPVPPTPNVAKVRQQMPERRDKHVRVPVGP
jgi:hypothetical protein